MAGQQALLLVGFLLPGLLLSEAAKILTLSLVGGSHFLLMNRVSQILQDHGRNVTMLLQRGNLLLPGFKEEEKSYKVINWFLPEDYNKEFKKSFHFFMEETFEGRQKSAMVDTSIMKRSHPLTPSQQLVGWIDHILQTGGVVHLKPHTFQEP